MPAPTVSSVTPALGLASGDQLITIQGTNFRPAVHATPPDPFTILTWPQTAQVLFDGVPSLEVRVQSATQLQARLPPGDPGPGGAGRTVTVTIVNLDQNTGLPIPGESVAVPNAFSYRRPLHTTEYESDFTRLLRGMMQLMKRQLLDVEVNWAVQTDYDATTGDELHVTKFGKLPGIVIVGPDLEENRFYSLNQEPEFDDGSVSGDGTASGGYLATRVAYTVDATLEIIAASDTKTELLNLMANFVAFMHKNKWLYLNRSATDPTKGQVRYEFDFVPRGQPKNTTMPNNSNVRSWSAHVVIRGIDIEAFSGIADGTSDPSNLIPQHAVVRHGQTADIVSLVPTEPLGIS